MVNQLIPWGSWSVRWSLGDRSCGGSEGIRLLVDTDGDGNIDYAAFDRDRYGEIDESVCDTNHDGKPDLVGYHKGGSLEPYRFEKI